MIDQDLSTALEHYGIDAADPRIRDQVLRAIGMLAFAVQAQRSAVAEWATLGKARPVTVVYERSEGWVCARLLELPGAISQGRTIEEARANVLEAARDLLELYRDEQRAPEEIDIIGTETLQLDVA